jgi:hypothetical protein
MSPKTLSYGGKPCLAGGALCHIGRSGDGRTAFDPPAGTSGRPAQAFFHRAVENDSALQPCGHRDGVFRRVLVDAPQCGWAILPSCFEDYRVGGRQSMSQCRRIRPAFGAAS